MNSLSYSFYPKANKRVPASVKDHIHILILPKYLVTSFQSNKVSLKIPNRSLSHGREASSSKILSGHVFTSINYSDLIRKSIKEIITFHNKSNKNLLMYEYNTVIYLHFLCRFDLIRLIKMTS